MRMAMGWGWGSGEKLVGVMLGCTMMLDFFGLGWYSICSTCARILLRRDGTSYVVGNVMGTGRISERMARVLRSAATAVRCIGTCTSTCTYPTETHSLT